MRGRQPLQTRCDWSLRWDALACTSPLSLSAGARLQVAAAATTNQALNMAKRPLSSSAPHPQLAAARRSPAGNVMQYAKDLAASYETCQKLEEEKAAADVRLADLLGQVGDTRLAPRSHDLHLQTAADRELLPAGRFGCQAYQACTAMHNSWSAGGGAERPAGERPEL